MPMPRLCGRSLRECPGSTSPCPYEVVDARVGLDDDVPGRPLPAVARAVSAPTVPVVSATGWPVSRCKAFGELADDAPHRAGAQHSDLERDPAHPLQG